MIVLIKSDPETTDGARGVTLAKEAVADIILLQDGVFFGQKGRLDGFQGKVYMLNDDKKLRGLRDAELDGRAVAIGYDRMTELMVESEKIVGMF